MNKIDKVDIYKSFYKEFKTTHCDLGVLMVKQEHNKSTSQRCRKAI